MGILHLQDKFAFPHNHPICSYVGKTQISSAVEEYMHSFWEMIGYFMNTVIFVMSGVIMIVKLTSPTADLYVASLGFLFAAFAF